MILFLMTLLSSCVFSTSLESDWSLLVLDDVLRCNFWEAHGPFARWMVTRGVRFSNLF